MKNYLRVFPFFILLFVVGCAGSSKYMAKTAHVSSVPREKAIVYFMRPSGFGFGIHFQIWDRYRLIGLSQAKCYFSYECDPGKHLFIGRAENKRAVEANLEAGKCYYLITRVMMGAWKARMAFIPVTRGSEFWDKVLEYEKTLNFVSPKEEVLAEWVAKRKADVDKELSEIISFLNTPEGQQYIVKLNKEDGR